MFAVQTLKKKLWGSKVVQVNMTLLTLDQGTLTFP